MDDIDVKTIAKRLKGYEEVRIVLYETRDDWDYRGLRVYDKATVIARYVKGKDESEPGLFKMRVRTLNDLVEMAVAMHYTGLEIMGLRRDIDKLKAVGVIEIAPRVKK